MVISKKLANKLDRDSLLAKVLEVTKDAVVVIDEDSNIMVFNHGAEEIFGYAADEVINQNLSIILPDYVKDMHAEFVKKFDREHPIEGEPVEMKPNGDIKSCDYHDRNYRSSFTRECTRIHGVRKDGEVFPIDATITKLLFKGEKYFTAIIRDVSEREVHIDKIEQQQNELAAYRHQRKRELLGEMQVIIAKTARVPRG